MTTHLICGLIPVYNNHHTIADVVHGVLHHVEHVVVVDDGSDDGTESILDALADQNEKVLVIHQSRNLGKGAAVQRGLKYADEHGFTHAVQVDGDGQHNLDNIPQFLQAIIHAPDALIIGKPIFDDDIPFVRKHGRKLTNYMMALEMGTLNPPDGNCGFRAYPVAAICAIGEMGKRMNWDPEVVVRASWTGLAVVQVPTQVRYLLEEDGGVSHFRMFHDNVLHTWLHIRLILQAPWRLLLKALNRILR